MDPFSAIAGILSLYKMVKDGNGQQPSVGLDPAMQDQVSGLLGMQQRRLQRTEPIHEAAMAMASRMAPAYARGASSGGAPRPTVAPTLPPSYSGHGAGSPAIEAAVNLIINSARDNALTNGGGPGARDPFLLGSPSLQGKGPGIDPRRYDPIGPGWRGFFAGNPGNAFTGGGVTGGGGEQQWSGGKGRAV